MARTAGVTYLDLATPDGSHLEITAPAGTSAPAPRRRRSCSPGPTPSHPRSVACGPRDGFRRLGKARERMLYLSMSDAAHVRWAGGHTVKRARRRPFGPQPVRPPHRRNEVNHPDPLDIDCPTCTAKAGEPCKVRKRRGTYQSPEHFQSFDTAQPMHQKRIDKAADLTYDWLPFMPGRVTGRAARLRIVRRYAPRLLPDRRA